MSAKRVLVVGDLLYDLLARVEGVAFGTDTFTTIHAVAGGSGANTATWLARLGAETHFVGRVGDDIFGRYLIQELENGAVTPHTAVDPSLNTGKVFVLVDKNGERTMITDRGAGENLATGDLPENLFTPHTHLHLSGYLFSGESRKETAVEALRRARDADMSTSVDPSSESLLRQIGPDRFLQWTEGVDLCFPNHQEGKILSGAQDPGHITAALLQNYLSVVLKLGPAGALYAGRYEEQIHLPAQRTQARDTTGAGDAFCAGFLAARHSGASPKQALREGTKLASKVIEKTGGRPES